MLVLLSHPVPISTCRKRMQVMALRASPNDFSDTFSRENKSAVAAVAAAATAAAAAGR
jgi:hypothetical protein